MEEDLLDLPGSGNSAFSEDAVLKAIEGLSTTMKEFMDTFKKKPDEEEDKKYPYPEKMQEWMKDPTKFDAFQKEAEAEKEKFQTMIKSLEERVAEFEAVEKGEKIDKLLDMQEEKGLIQSEMREELRESFVQKFSAEQLDTLIGTHEKMDFSKAEEKSKKGNELGTGETKDFKARKEEIEIQLKDFDNAGVGGPGRDAYQAELDRLNGEAN